MNIVQEDGEVEIARGVAEAREEGRGFTAMLCAVIDHVDEAMPEDALARLAFVNGIGDGLVQVFFAEGGKVGAHEILFLTPTRRHRLQSGELRFGQLLHRRAALETDAPGELGFEDVGQCAAQAAVGKFRGREEVVGGEVLGGGEEASVGPEVVVEEEEEGGEVHGAYFTR